MIFCSKRKSLNGMSIDTKQIDGIEAKLSKRRDISIYNCSKSVVQNVLKMYSFEAIFLPYSPGYNFIIFPVRW